METAGGCPGSGAPFVPALPGLGEWLTQSASRAEPPARAPGAGTDPSPRGTKEPRAKRVREYEWQCGYCNEWFTSHSDKARYCSPTHKKYAQRERKRERELQASCPPSDRGQE